MRLGLDLVVLLSKVSICQAILRRCRAVPIMARQTVTVVTVEEEESRLPPSFRHRGSRTLLKHVEGRSGLATMRGQEGVVRCYGPDRLRQSLRENVVALREAPVPWAVYRRARIRPSGLWVVILPRGEVPLSSHQPARCAVGVD